MANSLLQSAKRLLVSRGLVPRSRLARLTIALFAAVVIWSLFGIGSYFLLYALLFLVCGACLLVLAYRAFKQHFMWRLRDRLIVTYVFIGVIPLVLLATMAVAAGYLFAGQFSTFVVSTDVQTELRRLESSNRAIAHQAASALRQGKDLASIRLGIDNEAFPGRQIVAYHGGTAELLSGDAARPLCAPPAKSLDDAVLVLDEGELYLRAVHRSHLDDGEFVLVSSVPLDAPHLNAIVPNMGIISLYGEQVANAISESKTPTVHISEFDLSNPKVTAGVMPPALSRMDVEFIPFVTKLTATHWLNGETNEVALAVRTRPSLIYSRLFRTLGDMTEGITAGLAALAVFFAILELAALIVGVRLTRTMTSSVSKLYHATQRINRGDFSHRIHVSSKDQLASLESSFNSMTESLEKLIAEQKEKQRIESELGIAKEVQDLLFPRDTADLDGLILHGVCRPARTVSGDYYDFIPSGPNSVGLAMGDISGKGISAALMMATVHAFVRAHTIVTPLTAMLSMAAGAEELSAAIPADGPHHQAGASNLRTFGGRTTDNSPSPALVMAMLNQQLYDNTPAQKYATMFLGIYDQRSRQFTYSNAGHLPPLVVCADGTVHQLTTGGTVVGLFGGMTYPEARVTLNPGDIVVAYSDGITEPENDYGEFGEERLTSILVKHRGEPLARISDAVLNAVTDWIGGEEQPDDMTIVLARAR